jgi:hypothetical protein
LKHNQEQMPEVAAVECDVAAHAQVCVPLEALADLRRQPGPAPGPNLPANSLKHADEQTIAGLSAVYHAIHNHGLRDTDFRDWAVLGAPRFPGRPLMIPSITRFLAEGAWGVSPHLVPHRSLHSLSGTISQALKIHGPNYGVGGGNSAAEEVVFAALALLARQQIPGVWMVLTAFDPETALDDNSRGATDRRLRALALALKPVGSDRHGLRLTLEMVSSPKPAQPDYFKLFTMLEQLCSQRAPGLSVTQPWQQCARLTLSWVQEAAGVTAHSGHARPGASPFMAARAGFARSSAEVSQ